MERKYDFEMEFLISLILAILALEGAKATQAYLADLISVALSVAIFTHIVVLVLAYILRRVSENPTPQVENIDAVSSFTLIFNFGAFLFFVIHFITNFGYTEVISLNRLVIPGVTTLLPQHIELVVIYGVPGFIVFMVGLGGYRFILLPISISNDIKVSINPETLNVYSSFSESNPITVHVRNESEKEIDANIHIEIPEGLEFREMNTESSETDRLKHAITIPGPGENSVSFESRVTSGERRSLSVEVSVDYGYGMTEEEVQVFANPH